MELIYTPNLPKLLYGKTVVIDTCVIIEASKQKDFKALLDDLYSKGCTFLSVVPVRNEFLAMADNRKDYGDLINFLDTLHILFLPPNIEHRLEEKGTDFSIAMRRSKVNKPSYVDRLLLSIPYLYGGSSERIYVMTSNHHDVPEEFYDRIGFMVWDNQGKKFTEIGLYNFNSTHFDKIIQKI